MFLVFLKYLVISKGLIDKLIDWASLSLTFLIVMVDVFAGVYVDRLHIAYFSKVFDLATISPILNVFSNPFSELLSLFIGVLWDDIVLDVEAGFDLATEAAYCLVEVHFLSDYSSYHIKDLLDIRALVQTTDFAEAFIFHNEDIHNFEANVVFIFRRFVLGPELVLVEGAEGQKLYFLKKLGDELLAMFLKDDDFVGRVFDDSFELVFSVVL